MGKEYVSKNELHSTIVKLAFCSMLTDELGDDRHAVVSAILAFDGVIDEMESADVVEPVRCKDCQYANRTGDVALCCRVYDNKAVPFEGYCWCGKKKEDDDDGA